jgi:beta-glucosidase
LQYWGISTCKKHWLLTTLLRNNWGFNGYVVSDCGAIADMYNKYPQGHGYVDTPEEASSLAIKAGCELTCTFTNDYSYLVNAVKQGLISEEEIDKAVTKLFEARFRLGMFDPPSMVKYTQIPYSVVDSQEHRQLALEAARKAIVLLKNNNILPLKKDAIKSIAVIGPNANETKFGAYSGVASKAVSPFEGIKNKANAVTFSKGCFIDGPPTIPSQYLIPSDSSLGAHGLKGEYFNNKDLSGKPALVRLDEEIDFNWDDNSPDWDKLYWEAFSVRWTGQFIPPKTGEFEFSLYTDDGSRLYINDKLLIDSWTNRGSAPEEAKGSIRFEEGKPVNIKIEYYQNGWNSTARLGSYYFTDSYMSEAIEIAKKAQLVIVVTGVAEVEEKDRMDLTLPGLQSDLIDQISSVNKNTIVVLNAGSVVDMTKWIDKVGAVVEMWYGGEEGGTALADVLFGDYNPGGKLPLTFYKSDEQLPPMDDYDITKGRTYMYLKDKPQFAFGHGLSYTTFKYSDLQVESDNKGNGKVSVVVQNVGKQKGDEVVQLYIHDVVRSTNDQPIKELIGFKRTTLEPNQAKRITFYITPSLLAFYNKDLDFIVEPGDFDILVGSSSDDIKLQDKLSVNELLVVERYKDRGEK